MKKNIITIVVSLVALGILLAHAEEAPSKIKNLASTSLAAYGTDPEIVSAVKKANEAHLTLDQIKQADEKWRQTPGIDDFMKSLLESGCSNYLRNIQGKNPYLSEIFVTDNQGANVALTDKTSDYWQGDEDKFVKAFDQGKGAVFISQIEFDDSSQAYLVQISVPVMDGNTCIGTITFGVDVDQVD